MLDMPWWMLGLIVLVPLGLLALGAVLIWAVVTNKEVSRTDYDKDLDRYL
ncbi:MAG TPA: hypothetical protein VFB89_03550 [Gemmatimonadales bacterium]|nr:hypothetical protein [Gemmatimonadales bacterium]